MNTLRLVFSLIGILAPRAYIDPNTGGMLFQILVVIFAAFSGMLFFFSRQIKAIFARIRRFFLRTKAEDTTDQKS